MQNLGAYKQAEVNAADNVKVVSMLYDGSVNFLKMAKQKLKDGDLAGKGLYVGKTTAIVSELSSCLDMEAGGEIAKNLDRLYDYVIERITHGHLKNDPGAFDDAEKVLEALRNGWKEMEQKRHAAAPAALSAPSAPGASIASSQAGLASGVGLKV